MSADLLTDSLQPSVLGGGGGGTDSFLCEDDNSGGSSVADVSYDGCEGVLYSGAAAAAADLVDLRVADFDLGEEMELDGFPVDLWPGLAAEHMTEEDSLGLEAKLGTDFSCLEEDFHQMLDEWDSQLGSLQASDLESTMMGPLVSIASAVESDALMSATAAGVTCPTYSIGVGDDNADNDDTVKTELAVTAAEEDLKPDVLMTAAPTSAVATPMVSSSAASTTICVRRPFSAVSASPGSLGRGLMAAGGVVSRQLPVISGGGGGAASALRSPVISRGICYTRTGGLGVTRSVQSSNLVPGSQQQRTTVAVSTASQISHSGIGASNGGISVVKVKSEDPTFVFTPVSPCSAPGSSSSSNAPDFFVASTRSTADVKSSYSSYCRLIGDEAPKIAASSGISLRHSATEFHMLKSELGVTGAAATAGFGTTATAASNNSSSQVKIIASLSPKRDGSSSTRIISSRSIRDSLPKELIDKIKAASQGRKTIAIIEPITRNGATSGRSSDSGGGSSMLDAFGGRGSAGVSSSLGSRFSVAAANLNRWRSVGVVPPLSNSNNNISDHDYCCPSRPGGRYRNRFVTSSHSRMLRQIEDTLARHNSQAGSRVTSPVEEETTTTSSRKGVSSSSRVSSPMEEARKDSGLESCEMSDCSEDGGLYDRLPGYLTNISVQTSESAGVMEEHGYNRLPAYLVKPQQSLLKSSVIRVAERSTMVVAPLEQQQQQYSVVEGSFGDEDSASKSSDTSSYTCSGQLDRQTGEVIFAGGQLAAAASSSQSSDASRSDLGGAAGSGGVHSNNVGSLKRRRRDSSAESSDNGGGGGSSSDEEGGGGSSYRKRRFISSHREYKVRRGGGSPDRRSVVRTRRRSSSCSSSPDTRSYRRRSSHHVTNSNINSLHPRIKKPRPHVDEEDDLPERRPPSAGGRRCYGRATSRRPAADQQQPEKQRQVDERRVVYVGGIAEGTLKADLRQRFEMFGPIVDISLHFRERGNNYGFVTFEYQADAYAAVEHGNEAAATSGGQLPRYELSFGGRRAFCKEKYFDMDDVEEGSGGEGGLNLCFDELLRRARGRK